MLIRKVLLIDDEPDLRAIGNLSLRNIGKWQVLLAGSCAEALALITKERPDCVLLDVMMPDLDGPATLLRIRELPEGRDLPIVFLTALTEQEEHDRLLALGAKGVIQKPFAPLLLPRQLRALVE